LEPGESKLGRVSYCRIENEQRKNLIDGKGRGGLKECGHDVI